MDKNLLFNTAEVILKVSEGDEKAFTELFYHYYQSLGKSVFKIIKNSEVTEEVVQDVFIKIWARRETLTVIHDFDKYLYIIVRNEAITRLKKIASERIAFLHVEKLLQQDNESLQPDDNTEVYREMIAQAVAKLPDQQRKVYIMSRYDKLKYSEIADRLGLSPTTVKKHIHLAVTFIRNNVSAKTDLPIAIIMTTTMFFID